ncbi:MAG: helix-turn-helix domain-containing protein [Neisseria sp.]|nr:helix-turn-helix domain-containing protein [Neisseria sp.]
MDTVKIIKTKDDHREAMARLNALMDLEPLDGTDEALELEALALLIEAYEKQQGFFEIKEPPTALELIAFRMEQNGLTAKDMQAYFGSAARVSEVLNGKRPLSLAMMQKLNKGLNIPAELLLHSRP